MKNKWNVEIDGIALTIHTDYDESYVTKLADSITEKMEQILINSRRSSKLDAALLILLDMMDANEKLEVENVKMKRQLEEMKLDLDIANIEKEKLIEKTEG